MQAKRAVKRDKGRIIIFTVFFVVFVVYSFLCLYPIFFCLTNSMKSVAEYYAPDGGTFALPEQWGFHYYRDIIESFHVGEVTFWEMILNSVYQAFGYQILNILASIFVAYPLARYNFPLKKFFYGLLIFKITIPIIGGGAAGYKLLRALGMINNPATFALTFFMGFDLNALIMYGYFKGISKEYDEAAYIDGANRLQTLFRVVLPQAMPCIIALYVSCVMGRWNDYSTPLIYLPKFPNLALGIFEFEKSALFIRNGTAMFFGAVILSSIVPLGLFAAAQKLMLTNVSVGGLKG